MQGLSTILFAVGSERTLEIVRRVRKFAHLGAHVLEPVDLHAELDDTRCSTTSSRTASA